MRATVFFLVSVIMSGTASAAVTPGTDIDSFLKCMNDNKEKKQIAEAVECLPPKCLITLTMSTLSRQPACKVGACQMPRAILECPPATDKKPVFRPEFSLCPTPTVRNSIIPLESIEMGMDVGNHAQFKMEMAGLPVPFGGYEKKAIQDILNHDNKRGCAECHGQQSAATPVLGPAHNGVKSLLGRIIDPAKDAGPDLGNAELTPFVICTGGKKAAEKRPEDFADVKSECLPEVCKCLEDEVKNCKDKEAKKRAEIALALCNALRDYENDKTRGVKR